ncbi:MAG: PRC-barrel domain-containing protein [Alphaproteobacteria bacterium]|uniref:PRC-barrel domain-containing protein n=1 Tax=Candidatus Nitrobium versatile TaxID=2884831 RepID=A0A953JBU0_9BACT|nr:PRC-barrel domain-containing protein [Candidatus Nitrobium versatile]
MLRGLKPLSGYKVLARDGEIGKVHDFLFDEHRWTIRYLVVDTGKWISGRRVLISPEVVGEPQEEKQGIPVRLTREQVRSSPGIDMDLPLTRRRQRDLHRYYGWSSYWAGEEDAVLSLSPPTESPPPEQRGTGPSTEPPNEEQRVSLWSTREVIGYHLRAADGEIGHVDDFIAGDTDWIIRYMAVDTRNWLPGKRVLIVPEWIVSINRHDRKVLVNISREYVKHSPRYDPSVPLSREYEVRFYDYYKWPKYWI